MAADGKLLTFWGLSGGRPPAWAPTPVEPQRAFPPSSASASAPLPRFPPIMAPAAAQVSGPLVARGGGGGSTTLA